MNVEFPIEPPAIVARAPRISRRDVIETILLTVLICAVAFLVMSHAGKDTNQPHYEIKATNL